MNFVCYEAAFCFKSMVGLVLMYRCADAIVNALVNVTSPQHLVFVWNV